MLHQVLCIAFRVLIVQIILIQLLYSLMSYNLQSSVTTTTVSAAYKSNNKFGLWFVNSSHTSTSPFGSSSFQSTSGTTSNRFKFSKLSSKLTTLSSKEKASTVRRSSPFSSFESNNEISINSIESLNSSDLSKHVPSTFEQSLRDLEEQDRHLTYKQRAAKAFAHGVQLQSIANCSTPKPKLIYINLKQKSQTVFLPRASLLHRCDDLFGCCATNRKKCVAVDWRPVSLYFFTITMGAANEEAARLLPSDLHLDEGHLMNQLLAEDRLLLERLNGKRKRHDNQVGSQDRRKRKLFTLPNQSNDVSLIDSDEPILAGRWIANALIKKGHFQQAVERLVFVNHTRCACVDKTLL